MGAGIIDLFGLVCLVTRVVSSATRPPHIVFIVADDLGWNDVSWNNDAMKMPTLDKLARKGVILNSSYVQPVCTPSRAAMLTGYYPYHMGLQRGIIHKYQTKHLPTDKQILPEALKEQGYATHMVGKWHLGFCNWNYTPTYRGFDSFYGFYSGAEDYYDHTLHGGYDFRFNETIHHPIKGRYSTSLFGRRAAEIVTNHNPNDQPLFLYLAFQGVHSPLQVPKRFSRKHAHVENRNRRIYNGMVSAMDEAVDKLLRALKRNGYMNNLLIVFTSDNGGASYLAGSNWPLRGTKNTLWEGGTRVPGFVYSKTLLKKKGLVYNGMIHATDWFPTLVHLAGGKTSPFIDGMDQWWSVSRDWPSPRTEFVYNINERKRSAAIRVGDYKLIVGSPGRYNNWYPEKTKPACNSKQARNGYRLEERLLRRADMEDVKERQDGWWFSSPFKAFRSLATGAVSAASGSRTWRSFRHWYDRYRCDKFLDSHKLEEQRLKPPRLQLFNLAVDPLEKKNLARRKPMLLKKMMRKFRDYKRSLVPNQDAVYTKAAHPRNFDGIWSPGWC